MIEVLETAAFAVWLQGLADVRARAKILVRIQRLALGNPGDARPVGDGVSEMRIDHGPGFRVYFARIGPARLVLLVGGDKRTQRRDIRAALRIARSFREAP